MIYEKIYLTAKSSARSELSIEPINRLINQFSEYWYIGSIFARSAIVKNNTVECMAMGLYPRRAASIFFSVSSAMA